MVEQGQAGEPEQTIAYRGRHLAVQRPDDILPHNLSLHNPPQNLSLHDSSPLNLSLHNVSPHRPAPTARRPGFDFRGVLVPLSLLVVGLLISMTAFASAVTFADEDGANDEPGQKDLTLLTVDNAGLPTSLAVTWNWDVTTISGNNTVDGCSLFDSDGDSLANFAVCEVWGNDPVAPSEVATRLYTCTDTRADRCSGPTEDTTITSTCDVAISGTDPFVTGESYPNDVKATCTINLADVGAANAVLLNVCSYPSQQPNSDPSDCVLVPATASSSLRKWRPRTTTQHFPLLWMAVELPHSQPPAAKTSAPIAVRSDINHSVAEAVPTGWDLDSASCTLSGGGPTGTLVGSTISDIDVVPTETTTCTFNDTAQGGTLIVIKHVINDNGGSATAAEFTLDSGGANDTPDDFAGAESPGTSVTLDAGSYNVTESGPSGYAASFSTDCSGTIANGQTKTCTVTNDDQAGTLTVIKHVINDNGGTARAGDFTLDSGGANDSPDDFAGEESPGTTVTLDAGSYNVTETGPSGYAASYSADCSGTIANGAEQDLHHHQRRQAPDADRHQARDQRQRRHARIAADFTLTRGGANESRRRLRRRRVAGNDRSRSTPARTASARAGPAGYAASYSADCSGLDRQRRDQDLHRSPTTTSRRP